MPLWKKVVGGFCVFLALVLFKKALFYKREVILKNPIPLVRCLHLKAEKFLPTLYLTGHIEADKNIILKAEVQGKIAEFFTKKGTLLKAEEPILRILDKDIEERYKETIAKVEHKTAEFNAAQRLKTQSFIAQNKLLEAIASLETAKANLKSKSYEKEQLIIKAPFKGIFDEKYVDVGDYVSIGTPIIRMTSTNYVKIISSINEKDRDLLSVGQKAFAYFVNKQKKYIAFISSISSTASSKTRSYEVELIIDDPSYNIENVGQTVFIEIEENVRYAHHVPSSSLILNDEGQLGIMVNDNEIARFYHITILKDEKDYTWISIENHPLEIELISLGSAFITDGQKIRK
ncbi:MAG: efflux RND transporter periplasmic adaptor subunit [Alphaproteobacteria bacterium]